MKLCLKCNQYFEDGIEQCPQDRSPLESVGDDTLIGAVISDRYLVESVIGKGSTGIVYKAKRLDMAQELALEVAVKVLHSYIGAPQSAQERFLKESRAATYLRNPHIITLWESGITTDNQPYFVMDYLVGKTIAALLNDKGFLDIHRALPIVRQVCEALIEAHRLDIIHGDIKPENIVLEETGHADDFVKVLDFGIAELPSDGKNVRVQLEKVKLAVGNPAYMSPEQCQGKPLDRRSDLYSLAVVIFEMLTGVRPFVGPNSRDVMLMHLTQEPPSLASKRPDLKFAPALEKVIAKALSKNPDDRQQTVADFLTELESACPAIDPVTAAITSAVLEQFDSVSVQDFSVPVFDRLITPVATTTNQQSVAELKSRFGPVPEELEADYVAPVNPPLPAASPVSSTNSENSVSSTNSGTGASAAVKRLLQSAKKSVEIDKAPPEVPRQAPYIVPVPIAGSDSSNSGNLGKPATDFAKLFNLASSSTSVPAVPEPNKFEFVSDPKSDEVVNLDNEADKNLEYDLDSDLTSEKTSEKTSASEVAAPAPIQSPALQDIDIDSLLDAVLNKPDDEMMQLDQIKVETKVEPIPSPASANVVQPAPVETSSETSIGSGSSQSAGIADSPQPVRSSSSGGFNRLLQAATKGYEAVRAPFNNQANNQIDTPLISSAADSVDASSSSNAPVPKSTIPAARRSLLNIEITELQDKGALDAINRAREALSQIHNLEDTASTASQSGLSGHLNLGASMTRIPASPTNSSSTLLPAFTNDSTLVDNPSMNQLPPLNSPRTSRTAMSRVSSNMASLGGSNVSLTHLSELRSSNPDDYYGGYRAAETRNAPTNRSGAKERASVRARFQGPIFNYGAFVIPTIAALVVAGFAYWFMYVQKAPLPTIPPAVMTGEAAYRDGRLEEAMAIYEKRKKSGDLTIAESDRLNSIYITLAKRYGKQGNYREALKLLKKTHGSDVDKLIKRYKKGKKSLSVKK